MPTLEEALFFNTDNPSKLVQLKNLLTAKNRPSKKRYLSFDSKKRYLSPDTSTKERLYPSAQERYYSVQDSAHHVKAILQGKKPAVQIRYLLDWTIAKKTGRRIPPLKSTTIPADRLQYIPSRQFSRGKNRPFKLATCLFSSQSKKTGRRQSVT